MCNNMQRLSLLLIFLAVSVAALADLSDYSFFQSTSAYTEITGGTVLGTNENNQESFNAIPLGFPFTFNEVEYTEISVQADGFIAFGHTVTQSNNAISSSTGTNNVAAAFNRDLKSKDDGSLSYLLSGTAPNRVFTIQWKNYRRVPTNSANDVINFQIQLKENGNAISFHYGNMSLVNVTTARTVQVGLRGASNAEFLNRTTTDDWLATTAGAANYASCRITDTVFPPSGLMFTYALSHNMVPMVARIPIPAHNAINVNINAELSWMSGGGTVDGYKVFLGTNNPPTNMVNGTIVTGTSYAHTANLNYSTDYYWKIVPFNNIGDAVDCPVWKFTTLADPTVTTFPYTQNFDDVAAPAIPLGWITINANNDNCTWETSTLNPHSGVNSIRMRYNSNLAANDWLVSPPLSLEADENYEIKFYYRAHADTFTEKLALYWGNVPTVAGLTTQIWQNDAIINTEYQEVTTVITPTQAGNFFLGFKAFSDANQYFLYLDSITISHLTLPQVTDQFNPIQISWNSVNQSIELDNYFSGIGLTYSVSGNSMIDASVVSGNVLSLAPATDWYGTEYLTIRATNLVGYVEQVLKVTVIQAWQITESFDHEGGQPNNWTAAHAGTTDYPWQPVQIDGDDYAMKTMATTGRTANERLFSPNYNLSNFQEVVVSFDTDFLPYGSGSGTFAYSLNNVTYTVVETFNAMASGRKTYTLSNLDAKPSVKFRWIYANSSTNTGQDNHWIVDNFSIYGTVRDTQAPSSVEGLNLVSQTPSTVTLSWQASSDLYFGRYELYVSTDDQVTTTDQLWSTEQDPALAHEVTTQTTITDLATGDYWIAIRAVDLSANASSMSDPVFVHIDETVPVISDPIPSLQPEPLWTNSRTVEIGCSISDSSLIDPNSLYYRIDANGNGNYDDTEAWMAVPQTGRLTRNRDVLNLIFNVTYEADGVLAFEFKAANSHGNTGYSGHSSQEGIGDDWVVRIDTVPPADIANFFTEEVTENSVQLTWSASADVNFLGYRIHYSTSSDVDTTSPYWDWNHDPNLSYAGTGLVSTVLSGLDPATRYYFMLLATDEVGWITECPQVITAMTTSSAEPKAPENLSISIADGLLILDWDDVTEDVLGNPIVPSYYAVYVGDYPDFVCDFDSLIATVNESYLELADVVEYADRLFFKVIAVTGMIRKAE